MNVLWSNGVHAIIDDSIGKIVHCNQYQWIDYWDDDWIIKSTDAALQVEITLEQYSCNTLRSTQGCSHNDF